jgi:hypothetical protein
MTDWENIISCRRMFRSIKSRIHSRDNAAINAHLLGASFSQALSAMDLVSEYQLTPGTVLNRFVYVDVRRTPLSGADGPWWLESDSFKRLQHMALANGLALSRAAGRLASTRGEWDEVNGYVQAEVVGPLKCWKGKGKQVPATAHRRGRAHSVLPPVLQDVYQLYIPGIGGKSSLFSTSLRYLTFTSIQSTQPEY